MWRRLNTPHLAASPTRPQCVSSSGGSSPRPAPSWPSSPTTAITVASPTGAAHPGSRGRPPPPRLGGERHPRPEVRRGAQSSSFGTLPRQRCLAGRPGHRPQPGPLDRTHRSGRAAGHHQETLRRRFFSLPGRLTRKARRLTLHLPQRWPWETQFSRALARLRALPLPA